MSTTINEHVRNGVDTATLFATLDAVKAAPEAAKFQFRASNEWLSGTHNRSTIDGFFGVGEERSHERTFYFDADHPAVLVGRDNGPTRSSTCCTHLPRASPPAWPTSRPPAVCGSPRYAPQWSVTSTSTGSSA